jgi:hypothetical protein
MQLLQMLGLELQRDRLAPDRCRKLGPVAGDAVRRAIGDPGLQALAQGTQRSHHLDLPALGGMAEPRQGLLVQGCAALAQPQAQQDQVDVDLMALLQFQARGLDPGAAIKRHGIVPKRLLGPGQVVGGGSGHGAVRSDAAPSRPGSRRVTK